MKEIMAIALREIEARVLRRSFFLGAFILPIFLTLVLILPALLTSKTIAPQDISVFDQSGDPHLFVSLDEKVRESDLRTMFTLSQVVVPQAQDIDVVRREQDWRLEARSGPAFIVLRRGVLDDAQPEYYASNVADPSLVGLSMIVSSTLTGRRLANLGIDPQQIERRSRTADLKLIRVTPEGETRQTRWDYLIKPLILALLMFTGVFRLGQSVMVGLLEEKQSRVIEVLISSVRPSQLMIGKLLGIGVVGLGQLALWLVAVSAMRIFASAVSASLGGATAAGLLFLSREVLAAFSVYFILGYFMFGTIYAILGAMISRAEDIAPFQLPLTVLNMAPILLLWVVLRDPDGSLAVVLSIIPFFSPTLMVLRIAIASPPAWQIGLSIGLMLITTIGASWVAARVYRVGILLYGKKLTLPQIARWVKYA